MKDELGSDTCACFRDLPETDKFGQRPVFARYLRRLNRLPLDPPTDSEKRDAIAILRDSYLWADVLTDEAERIFAEAAL